MCIECVYLLLASHVTLCYVSSCIFQSVYVVLRRLYCHGRSCRSHWYPLNFVLPLYTLSLTLSHSCFLIHLFYGPPSPTRPLSICVMFCIAFSSVFPYLPTLCLFLVYFFSACFDVSPCDVFPFSLSSRDTF